MSLPESWRKIGSSIRYLRKTNHLTLMQLSRGCGLSANTISLVERGEVAPSVATLCKIANALGVSPGSLFLEMCVPQVVLQRAMQQDSADGADENLLRSVVDDAPIQGRSEPELHLLGTPSEIRGHTQPGRLSIICLQGEIECEVQGQTFSLEPGDNLCFNGAALRSLRNPRDLPGTAVLVLGPDQS